MGSNSRKHFDRGLREWGSKNRKEEGRTKKRSINEASIDDSSIDGGTTQGGKRRKKDTKRWCRGKVGREHKYVVLEEKKTYWTKPYRRVQCSGCRKMKYEWI